MPSAATRQMIPSDLWPSGRHSPGRCSPLQASPVQTEVDDAKAKLRKSQNPLNRGIPQRKDQKRQRTLSAKSGGNSATCVQQQQRPGSSQELGRVSPQSLPSRATSPDSEAFAMETPPAPHPSSLPMPPMEWLKPKAQSPLTVGHSLQAILTCRVAA